MRPPRSSPRETWLKRCSRRHGSMCNRASPRRGGRKPSRRSPTSRAGDSSTTSRGFCRGGFPSRWTWTACRFRRCSNGSHPAGEISRARDAAHLQLRHRHGGCAGCGCGRCGKQALHGERRDRRAVGRSGQRQAVAPASNFAGASTFPGEGMAEHGQEAGRQEARRRAHFRPRLEHGGADRGGQGARLSGRNRTRRVEPARSVRPGRARAKRASQRQSSITGRSEKTAKLSSARWTRNFRRTASISFAWPASCGC